MSEVDFVFLIVESASTKKSDWLNEDGRFEGEISEAFEYGYWFENVSDLLLARSYLHGLREKTMSCWDLKRLTYLLLANLKIQFEKDFEQLGVGDGDKANPTSLVIADHEVDWLLNSFTLWKGMRVQKEEDRFEMNLSESEIMNDAKYLYWFESYLDLIVARSMIHSFGFRSSSLWDLEIQEYGLLTDYETDKLKGVNGEIAIHMSDIDLNHLATTSSFLRDSGILTQGGRFAPAPSKEYEHAYWFENYSELLLARSYFRSQGEGSSIHFDWALMQFVILIN